MELKLMHLLIGGIIFLLLSLILNRKFQFYKTWVRTIKKLAPLYLVFFPPIITYLIVCGTLSISTVGIYKYVIGDLENFNPDLFIKLEKGVEYSCSFFMPILYFIFLKKEKFPSFWGWTIIITITHILTAGYRDAKLIFDPLNPTFFKTGPKILENMDFIDSIIPLLSLAFFYFFLEKKIKTEPVGNIKSTVGNTVYSK